MILEHVPRDSVTDQELANLLTGSADRRYGLIKRSLAKGELVRIRRGLYVLARRYRRRAEMNLFELAQQIYGPSYISLESALAFHGWIPEAVPTTTSASPRRSKDFHTPLGVFSFSHIPSSQFLQGVERMESSNGILLMASPVKALLDYVFVYKKKWTNFKPVQEDLRVEREDLKTIDVKILAGLKSAYNNRRIDQFIDGIKKDLKR